MNESDNVIVFDDLKNNDEALWRCKFCNAVFSGKELINNCCPVCGKDLGVNEND